MIADLLLSDATFALMSSAERRIEALELMKSNGLGDDELDAAFYVEEAEERHARGENLATEAPRVVSTGMEPCREDRASCASPVAATGRCMECGARRVAESPPADEAVPPELVETNALVPLMEQGLAMAAKPASPLFLARFKAATGMGDREIGDLLGRARSSVQAQVSGRIADSLTPEDTSRLAQALVDRVSQLAALREELGYT